MELAIVGWAAERWKAEERGGAREWRCEADGESRGAGGRKGGAARGVAPEAVGS